MYVCMYVPRTSGNTAPQPPALVLPCSHPCIPRLFSHVYSSAKCKYNLPLSPARYPLTHLARYSIYRQRVYLSKISPGKATRVCWPGSTNTIPSSPRHSMRFSSVIADTLHHTWFYIINRFMRTWIWIVAPNSQWKIVQFSMENRDCKHESVLRHKKNRGEQPPKSQQCNDYRSNTG
jgi:hypothetical protein